jgi:hypothetical protein
MSMKSLRDQWFDFWQRAQDIHHTAAKELNADKRRDILSELIVKTESTTSGKLNLRELYNQLEVTARQKTKAEGPQPLTSV